MSVPRNHSGTAYIVTDERPVSLAHLRIRQTIMQGVTHARPLSSAGPPRYSSMPDSVLPASTSGPELEPVNAYCVSSRSDARAPRR